MEQQDKDRNELLAELSELRRRVSRLESEREMLLRIQAKLGNALQRLNALGLDTVANINLWTAVCGEWLDGTYALYYRLKGNSLEPLGQWNTVENFQSIDNAEGYICHDVITNVGDETSIIRDLQNSAYTETDPSVKKYGLQTCIGRAVKVGGECAGCLCLFFKEDHAPSALDMAIIAICSMSIEREEDRHRAEVVLKENESRYRQLAENSLTGIFIHKDGKGVYANNRLAEMLGYSPEEIIGRPFLDAVHQEDRKAVIQRTAARLRGDELPPRHEMRLLRKSGETLWAEVLTTTIDYGGHKALMGNIADITERKAAQEALEKSERKYKELVEILPYFVYEIDLNRKFSFVNRAGLEASGYTWDDFFKGIHSLDLVIPEDRQRVAENIAKVLQEEESFVSTEYTMLRKDGSTFPVITYSAAKIEDGGITGVIAVGIDISERKKAEQELEESRERYRQLSEVTREGIVFHDKGVILDANRQYWEMFGYEHGELLGKQSISVTLAPESIDLVSNRVNSGLEGRYEVTGLRKDGTRFPLEIDGRLGEFEGREVRVATFRDLTDRKNLEEQLRAAHKMEAVGTLAGGIAHDFNNLLQIISGYAELLETELAKRDMRFSEIATIRQSADRGADLVKQLLTFSRRVESKFEIINLNDNVRETERLLYRTIPKMIKIELLLEEGLKHVRADSTQIEQLLINIAVNAQDAMPDGGKLTIETRNVNLNEEDCLINTDLSPGPYVLLKVSDTGHGIDEDLLPHIFEPFFTEKGLAERTGLGLATVFGIVKMHEGHIVCESEAAKGTTFKIYFPAFESVSPKVQQEQEMSAVAGGAETILVVDDEALIVGLAKRILENAGYSVITAGTGRKALEIYERERSNISLVILDLIMPEMGGKQCLEELLKINPQVKALIASGFAIRGDTKDFLIKEAKGTVSKPFVIRELLGLVRKVIDMA